MGVFRMRVTSVGVSAADARLHERPMECERAPSGAEPEGPLAGCFSARRHIVRATGSPIHRALGRWAEAISPVNRAYLSRSRFAPGAEAPGSWPCGASA
jgi:hypothetical protein